MMNKTTAFLSSFIASSVFAEPNLPSPTFEQLDCNQDGKISWQEYITRNPVAGRLNPRRIFDNVDKNLDGYIERDEFTAMQHH